MQSTDQARTMFLYIDLGLQLLLLVYWFYLAASPEFANFFEGLAERMSAWLLVTSIWQIGAAAAHWRNFGREEYQPFVRYWAIVVLGLGGVLLAILLSLYLVAIVSLLVAEWSVILGFYIIAYGHWALLPFVLWAYYLLGVQLHRQWFDRV